MSAHAMSAGAAGGLRRYTVGLGHLPARVLGERLGYVLFSLFIFFTCFTFLRPSPYDFFAIPTVLLWGILGLTLHRGAILFLALLVFYHVGLVFALIPYMDEPLPVVWTMQSLYLMVTCFFFVMFFSDKTAFRVKLAIDAYIASCVFASVCGIISYAFPTGILFSMDGRAAGVFEDPNLLGSFLTVGAIALLRRLLTGETRYPVASAALLLLMLTALFLSFSRGAWGAMVVGVLIAVLLTYRSSARPIRRRITMLAVAGSLVLAGGLAALTLDGDISSTLADRFTLTKDYDEGVTGRFGNQLRSIPLLVDQPNGFGPLRFRLRYGLEPHNSYIGGFANGGWLGGFAFLAMVLATSFVGIRLCLVDSPYRGLAQAFVPPTLMFFAQGIQIDIDHWRHVYIMLGMIWGVECARLRWLSTGLARAAIRPQKTPAMAWRPA